MSAAAPPGIILRPATVADAPAAPDLASLAEIFEVPLADGPLKVVSLPGVFSHGRLDRGTALLLEHLDKLPSGHLLDFGCGAGVLGAALAFGAQKVIKDYLAGFFILFEEQYAIGDVVRIGSTELEAAR